MRRGIAELLTSLGLAPMVAAALADRVSAPTTATLLSRDGTVIQAPAIGIIVTAEGAWTFSATARADGDYPVLLNGSAANGGWAAWLQVTNGSLYASAKPGGHYWIRFNGAWVDVGAAVPVEGTFATKVTIIPNRTKTPDNAPAGAVLATAKVTMSRSGVPFTGRWCRATRCLRFGG
jgi:hypothetical protein